MSERKRYILVHSEARRRAILAVHEAPAGHVVDVKPPPRSLDQNAKLWVLLGELSERVVWHGQRLTDSEWKDVMTAGLKRQRVVPGIDGGFVVLGSSTSRMTKPELSELIDLIYAFGAQQGVDWINEEIPA